MRDLPVCSPVAETMRAASGIPKRIIQTAKTSDLSLICQAAAANIKLLNPDFEYCFFDNPRVAAFIQDQFPEYLDAFNNFPHAIQRYDFFRYLAVYRLGGFYLDLDVFLARGLSSLLSFGCVFPFEELTLSDRLRKQFGIDWELGNYAFGAQAGHPFMKAVIDHCLESQRNPGQALHMIRNIPSCFRGQFEVFWTTGPGLVTRTLAEKANLRSTVAILFPDDVCDEPAWHCFGDYGVHLMHGSWRKKDGFLRARIARLWESWQRDRQLQESKRLGPRRPGEWTTIHSRQKNDSVAVP
jgi:mannosyltransferase OCH1-like enzyme